MDVAPRAHAEHRAHRPAAVWPLLGAMGFLALGGVVGGVAFLTDPTGASLGASPSWLDETPVHDFVLPGLFILGVYAIGTIALITGLLWRPSPGPLADLDRRIGFTWAWLGTILEGSVLVLWIVYEFTLFEERIALQPILLGVGLAMIAIPSLPSMRDHYRVGKGWIP
jgi:hypothetical protein